MTGGGDARSPLMFSCFVAPRPRLGATEVALVMKRANKPAFHYVGGQEVLLYGEPLVSRCAVVNEVCSLALDAAILPQEM